MKSFEIQRPQDIHHSDQSFRLEFYNAAESEDYDAMIDAVYDQNDEEKEELVGKGVIQEFYNGFIDAFLEAENFNQEGVIDELNDLYDEYNDYIYNLRYIGQYSSTTQYEIGNVILYNNNLYLVKVEKPAGTLPTNTTFCLKLGLRGEKGNTSLNLSGYTDWNNTTQYAAKKCVIYNNCLWAAKTSSTDKEPSIDSSYWTLVADYNKCVPYLSSSEPSYGTNGSLWLEVIN